MEPHEVIYRPWAKIGADICSFGKTNYLVLSDYYSSFFEVKELQYNNSEDVINCMK